MVSLPSVYFAVLRLIGVRTAGSVTADWQQVPLGPNQSLPMGALGVSGTGVQHRFNALQSSEVHQELPHLAGNRH
jgi:hypothetical protein